jgi:unsaturated chondroitin disaccharide hydrolase
MLMLRAPSALLLVAICSHALTAGSAPADAIDADRVMRVAARKLAAFDASRADKSGYPTEAKGAAWVTVPAKDWVSGFYPGALWYLYEYAQSCQWPDAAAWRVRAEAWTAGLDAQQFNTGTHDLGFMMFDSYGNGFRLTQNPDYEKVINRSAQSLAARYLPQARVLRSWGKTNDMDKAMIIIDNMMNLELLLWASQHGGTAPGGTSEDLRMIALTHADRTIELFFRPDGSTYHVVELDPKTGAVQRKRTAQGKADESCWSRGQTWAIYGFAYMAEATGERRYLDAALKAADFYLANLPADRVPPADYSSGLDGHAFKDSSAAAIAMCAFFRLHNLVQGPAVKKKFLDAAVGTLRALTSEPYFAAGDDKASLIVYSARNYHADPANRLTNTSLIWSDYYLLEGLLRYRALK